MNKRKTRTPILENPEKHTIWVEKPQWSGLEEIAKEKRVPIAALLRRGIDLILKEYRGEQRSA